MTTSQTVPLRSVCLGIYDGPHATPKPASEGPIYLGIKNITEGGRLDLSETIHVSPSDYEHWTRRVAPQPGDVVFTYEATLHRYALIPQGFLGCLGRRVALVRPDPNKVDARYLRYHFLSQPWRNTVDAWVMPGATVDRIPIERFPDFPITLPPLVDQQRIAEQLGAYDDLIDNNRRRMALLEDAARQLYREWFVRLRFPGHKKSETQDSLPAGWSRNSLQALCSDCNDGDWVESQDQGGSDYRLVQVSNIGSNAFVETNNFRGVTDDTFSRLRCQQLLPGDILVSRMPEPIGRAWLVTKMPWKMITVVDAAILRVNESVNPYYLLYHQNSAENLASCAQMASGATRPRISRKSLLQTEVVVPPRPLQDKFGDFAAKICSQRSLLQRHNWVLQQARDKLLPRLMRGELKQ